MFRFLSTLYYVGSRINLLCLFTIGLLLPFKLIGQPRFAVVTDSLRAGIEYPSADTVMIRRILDLANLYLHNGETDSSIKYAGLAVADCDRNLIAAKNTTRRSVIKALMLLKALSFENIGSALLSSNPVEAQRTLTKSIVLVQRLN